LFTKTYGTNATVALGKRNWFWWIIKLYGWQVFTPMPLGQTAQSIKERNNRLKFCIRNNDFPEISLTMSVYPQQQQLW
jgi:hypothetical protein